MVFQTEYEFELPRGYVNEDGKLCRHGVMRLATAGDEIMAMKEPEVRNNPEYMTVILLSRVVIRLNDVEKVTPQIIEKLFTADFTFLQNMYETINAVEEPKIQVLCPHCGKTFVDAINFCRGE